MTSQRQKHHKHTALLVDDEPNILKALSKILRADGYRVLTAASGEEAIQIFEREDISIVLADVNMPGMNGFTLCRRLKRDPRASHMPITLVTGLVGDEDVERGIQAGAVDYIKKPFDRAEVRMRVRTQIRLHEALWQKENLQTQLSHAQKLEAVGQLAAGIAHEINTPAQFVSDSVFFIKESFEDLIGLTAQYRRTAEGVQSVDLRQELLKRFGEADEEADLEYIQENLPGSFERCLEGLKRISTIVGAMKEFAHPDQRNKSPADINQALRATMTIARNEYKYVAKLESDLGDLPLVVCHVGDLNQVFLNLIVNASHAIGLVVGNTGALGTIKVRTAVVGDRVRIEIQDTGSGIPESVQDRVFDPFFTTKEVGVGSGQGLAIARSVVVDKHAGSLTFQTEEGKGSTFIIEIPTDGAERKQDA